ncbi:MAG: CotH kinase family protein, partial [Clostridia bacterium]|nr:CotH kinase family protein [Clostridia bacterium]
EGADSIMLNEEKLSSGDTTGLIQPGAELNVKWGKNKATLNVMKSANLNALFITTESGSMKEIHKDKEHRESGHFVMLSPAGDIALELPLDEIKGRGNSSFRYKKKPYQIKFEEKIDLLGMGKAKKWILLTNYIDNSLLRNRIGFEVSRAVGFEATCENEFVDLYLNHEYAGNYLLTEKMEIGKTRIDIADLEGATEDVNEGDLDSYPKAGRRGYKKNTRKYWEIPNDPEDITGGYLLELELTTRYAQEASGIVTKRGQPVVIKEPEYASEAQVNYIGDLLQAFEDAIFAKDGVNPTTGKHYSEYIDKESYVTKFLIEEVLKNYDANRTSQYFYKPADSQSTLLHAAPIWDFDQSLDNYGMNGSKAFLASNKATSFHWFPRAYAIPDFRQRVEELYAEKFVPVINILLGKGGTLGELRSIESYADEIKASAQMNFRRWGYIEYPERYTSAGKTFEESIAYLHEFLERRMENCNKRWLDQ